MVRRYFTLRVRLYLLFISFLIGVLSVLVYYSLTLRVIHDSEQVGSTPIFDEYYYYGDKHTEKSVPHR